MRSLLPLSLVLVVAFPLALSGSAEAVRFRRAKKTAGNTTAKKPAPGERVKGRNGLTAIFRRSPAKRAARGKAAAARVAARDRVARGMSKVKKGMTFDRFIRAQIGIMKFGSTLTLGAAIATGQSSAIAMAAVMTAGAYALGPLMWVAQRMGERIASRIDARGSAGHGAPMAQASPRK